VISWFRARIRRDRSELLLFALLCGTYAYFYQSSQHNEAARFDQLRSIVQDHTLEINKYWWNSADVIHLPKSGADHIYPNKAPGMTLAAVPEFGALGFFLNGFRTFGLAEATTWHLIAWLTTVFVVGVTSAVAAVVMYRLLRQIHNDSWFAGVAIVAIWLGTLVFPYSTLFFSHAFCGALLVISFALIFKLRRGEFHQPAAQLVAYASAGLLLGWSVISEYPTALLAAPISAYAIYAIARLSLPVTHKWKMVGVLIGGGAVAGMILLAYNVAAFGKLFYIPYQAYAHSGSAFPGFSSGWLRFQWRGVAEFVHAMAMITVHPQIGMVYLGIERFVPYACNPVLWFVVPGLLLMGWERSWRAEAIVLTVMLLAYVAFVATCGTSIWDWCGASYLGVRHLIPILPLLVLPLYFGARKLRLIFYPLLAISVFYMLLGTAIEPRAPYPYDNPARDFLLPDYIHGHLAQNNAGLFGEPRLLTKDSTAFNLGKLVGFPGALQLIPLIVLWFFVLTELMKSAEGDIRAGQNQTLPTSGGRWYRLSSGSALLLTCLVAISLPPILHSAAASLRHPRNGLLGKYYRNVNWSGEPVDVEVDKQIDFDWSKSLPLPPPFSVDWTGQILIEQPGNYTFGLIADDGAVLMIDGRVVVDVLHVLLQKRTGTVNLAAGSHSIQVRYFNALFGGSVRLWWTQTGYPEQIVPAQVLIPPSPTPAPRR